MTDTAKNNLIQINDIFKLPIHYNKEVKKLNTPIVNDLELVKSIEKDNTSIYETIFTPSTKASSYVLEQFANQYTTDKQYLQDTQTLIKSIQSDDLNTIKENFCYLFVGHWLQGDFGEDRKNVGYMIKAFLEVFKNKKTKPALVLKASQGAPSIMDRDRILRKIEDIRKTVSGDLPNIYLIHGDLYDEEINCLYNHPKIKAMVSFTKGEGFGRPLLEFSVVGKPIIASGWSGQVDFLTPEFCGLIGGKLENIHPSAQVPNMLIPDSQWFKPDDNQVGHALTDVFENYKEYQEKAKRLAYRNKQNFSFDKMTEKLGELVKQYVPEFPKQVEIKLPKLKKIN